MREVFSRLDCACRDAVSKLEFVAALQCDAGLAACVLPGVDCSRLLSDERSFEASDALFDAMAGGRRRLSFADFAEHFERPPLRRTGEKRLREAFDLIDADSRGCVSKLEFLTAVRMRSRVAALVLPGVDSGEVMVDERCFDAVGTAFDAMAAGRRRIDFVDFQEFFRSAAEPPPCRQLSAWRSSRKVLVVGPGFGQHLNPRQGAMIAQSGYQVRWCSNLPNPEHPSFSAGPCLGALRACIEEFRPDVLVCASKGGVYVVELWQAGFWRGPTMMLNAHPSLREMPKGVPVVLAQGSNDEVYHKSRAELERLVATGTPDMCYLYYTANSGELSPGSFSRVGDHHNMESLLLHDCLPRLIDAALCPEGPELSMLRSWRDRLSELRREAEGWLGFCPQRLRRLWSAPAHVRRPRGQVLVEVPCNSEEFLRVSQLFRAAPAEPPAYILAPPVAWERVEVRRVERVENVEQATGGAQPYYNALLRSLQDQGMEMEPGVHTRWAFHGTDAVDSILSNPAAAFQPLASGARHASLWGLGTYFARDAQYVADGQFCGPPSADGTRRMLLCFLMTGMPCLGDPQHNGVLPQRRRPHRYGSSVDSMSSPEVFVIQHPNAALPAYLITFA